MITVSTENQTRQPLVEEMPAGRLPLRIALVGCGAISEQMHLPVLAGHEKLRLAALVDRDETRARRLAEGYGVGRVLTDAALLDPAEIDAAIVATPPFHHGPCSIDLLKRGIHVLVEKPMALNLAEAEAMVQAGRDSGRVLSVGFFRRLCPSIRLLKSILDSRWLGRPLGFEVDGGGMYNWQAATLANMRKDWAGGGVLIDFGSHMLDLLLYLFDDPVELLEYRDNSLGGIESDCSLRLRLQRGGEPVEGTVLLARTRKLGSGIRVVCERGVLDYQVNERFRIKVLPSELHLADPATGDARGFWLDAAWKDENENFEWYGTFRAEIDDWIEAISAGSEPRLSGRSALRTVRLIDECYRRPSEMDEPWVREGLQPPEALPAGALPSSGLRSVHPTSSPGRVLITGATGFIGARIAEILHLRDGWNVRSLVHNPGNASRLARLPIEMVQGELDGDEQVMRLVDGCDAVVHCAVGKEWGNRRRNFEINVDGSLRLAKAALAAGVRRFVHFSTISVYGDEGRLTGVLDEAMPPRPMKSSDYGQSKAASEQAVLSVAQEGLNAAIFRPARVFGPFSGIFVNNPLAAMAERRFHWLGDPNVPCDMVYVDNVVHAVVRALASPDENVRGQIFNVGEGDTATWREFYDYFARRLDFDLAEVEIDDPAKTRGRSNKHGLWGGLRTVVGSREFRALGRRVLDTDPIGAVPRWALNRFPAIERAARKIVRADGSLPVYRQEPVRSSEIVHMGSGGAVASIDKARRLLDYAPYVPRERALELTLAWARHARIV